MGHLRIRILGPLEAWDVADDGVWRPLPLSNSGWNVAGVLAALIFDPPKNRSWQELANWLYDRIDVEHHEKKVNGSVRTAWHRARQVLDVHREVLPKGRDYFLAGRDDVTGPRRVYVDWDDAQRYTNEGRHKEALALLCSGLPLPGYPDSEGHLREIATEARDAAREVIAVNLRGVGQAVPDKLSWRQLEAFASFRPKDWEPRLAATMSAAPIETPQASTARDQELLQPPSSFGAFNPDELFESCEEGHARFDLECEEARTEDRGVWWGSHLWLGRYVALWHRTLDTPSEQIAFTYVDDVYDAARFGLSDVDRPKDKATLIEAPKQLGDNEDKRIVCGKTNWGLAHTWAKDHEADLFADPSNLSVFGVRGRPVYPNILGVHTLTQTSDGYLLFALRSHDVDFHELTWSASFEESVSVGPREFTGPPSGDRTVFHAIQGGLYEEWGIDPKAIRDTSCVAIGREWVRERDAGGSRLNLSPTILAACRLTLSLPDVWASLDEVARIRDRDEHLAWAGCRFADREALLRFVATAKGRTANIDLLRDLCSMSQDQVEMNPYPGGATSQVRDQGLMPTSAARLVLGSAWLEYRKSIDNIVT